MKTSQTRRFGNRRNQKGFGLALIMVVLLVMALVVGAIALANKGGSSKTDLETAKVMATSIVNRGNEIATAAQRVGQDRDLKTMTLNATTVAGTSFGLYDPAIGIASDVTIPGKAFVDTSHDVSFTLDKTAYTVVGIGSGGATVAAVTATLPGLTLATCQLINKTVYNDTIDAVPATVTTGLARTEGCLNVSSSYTYYKALAAAV